MNLNEKHVLEKLKNKISKDLFDLICFQLKNCDNSHKKYLLEILAEFANGKNADSVRKILNALILELRLKTKTYSENCIATKTNHLLKKYKNEQL
jgi:hypothetical protein